MRIKPTKGIPKFPDLECLLVVLRRENWYGAVVGHCVAYKQVRRRFEALAPAVARSDSAATHSALALYSGVNAFDFDWTITQHPPRDTSLS